MESLTYREFAERLGVKLESARKQVQRKRWQKVTGSDGIVRILVPTEALPEPGDNPMNVLETRIAGLHMLLAAERGRAEAAEIDRDHWRHQAQLLAERPKARG